MDLKTMMMMTQVDYRGSPLFSKRIFEDWNALLPEIVKIKVDTSFKKNMEEYWADAMYDIAF